MMQRETCTRHQRAMWLLLGALAVFLVFPTTQPMAAAAPDLVRTITAFPMPTQLVLDPRSGQVFVVSVGALAREDPNFGKAGLTQIDGSTGNVIHRWPGWPSVGPNPLAGRIMLQVGDRSEALPGDPSVPTFANGAILSDLSVYPALYDPLTDHILYLLQSFVHTEEYGFAVVDKVSKAIVHQQVLTTDEVDTDVDDPLFGRFVVASCHVPIRGDTTAAACTLWVVDARAGRVTNHLTTTRLNFIYSMAVDAQRHLLLLYDDANPPDTASTQNVNVQLQVLSLPSLRLLYIIPLPAPFGACSYKIRPQGIGVDEATGHALVLSDHAAVGSSCADTGPGTARLVDTRSGRLLSTVTVGFEPATVVVDSALHRAYVADAGSCDVSVIDMRAGKLVARVRTGKKFPVDELVDGVTGKVFVNNQFSGTVTMFDAATTRMDPPGC